MRLLRFIALRIAISAATLLGVSLLVFIAMRLVPGGFEDVVLGPFATPAAKAVMRARFGLDQPIPAQYWLWITAAAKGDFGSSMITRQPVLDEILRRLPATIELSLLALLISLAVGLPLGLASGVRQRGIAARLGQTIGTIGLGVPDFVLGSVLVYVFSRWQFGLMVGGYVTITGDWPTNLRSVALPALTLGWFGITLIVRTTDAAVREVLTQPHITAAVAAGETPSQIVRRHILRNAAIPVLTVSAAFFGYLLGGTIVIEQLFSVPGLGQYVITALSNRDYAVVEAGVLLGAAFFLLLNLLADICYALLDPRAGDEKTA